MSDTAPDTVILIRHGEKPGDDGPPRGVNRHGEQDEHSLSVRGWTRAGALAAVLAHSPNPSHPSLATPGRVFATRATSSYRSKREHDTAAPTALRLGLPIGQDWEHGDEAGLAGAVTSEPSAALVVWHHGRMVDLVRSFPLSNPDDVPAAWPEDRFDLYWILRREPGPALSYRFSTAPQLLLDGDRPAD
jgi:hypothetical protein